MLKNIVRFYVQGFANMTLGRTLWKIIVIKLLVITAPGQSCGPTLSDSIVSYSLLLYAMLSLNPIP